MNKKAEAYGRPVGRPAVANKRVAVHLNLHPEIAKGLKELSMKIGKSKSAIADEAIARYLDNT